MSTQAVPAKIFLIADRKAAVGGASRPSVRRRFRLARVDFTPARREPADPRDALRRVQA